VSESSFPLPPGVECFPVGSREDWLKRRESDVTASAIGTLLGVHEYVTEFQLWALKSGEIKEDPEATPAMERGTLLEPVAAELIRRRHPDWQITYPVGLYYREPASRIGATPDVFAVDPKREGFGNLQVKNVEPGIFRQKWQQPDGTIEPPLWIVIQSLTEAALTGASWAMVGALTVGHGLDLHLIEIPVHDKIMGRLRKASLAFWKRVAEKDPPPVNFEKDADTIKALYPIADEGVTIDLSGNNRLPELVAMRESLQSREADGNSATKERKTIDAEILSFLGSAAYGRLADGRLIEAKTIRRKAYAVEESSYRTIKIKEAMSAADSRSRIMSR
jgi:predicted phage-related endonuclease